jgi:hypothetical protein
MGKLIDLTGQKFGRLTVIRRVEDQIYSNNQSIPCWECKCECGETTVVPGVSLRSGNTKSCGCLQREVQKNKGKATFVDLIGQTFGFLTVIDRGPNGPRKETQWICKCVCGNTTVVRSRELRLGRTRSCGCKKTELFRESRKQRNRYDFYDDYVVGYTSSGTPFFIDPDDFEKVKDHCWVQFGEGDRCYITARMENGRNLFLHRLITGAKDDEVVDHLNHDGCDNRQCNLRTVLHKKNMLNLQIRIDNKSGVPGVWWDQERQKWQAYITCDKIHHPLGRFDTFEEAVAARKAAEERYFGEFSYDNSMAAVPRIAV